MSQPVPAARRPSRIAYLEMYRASPLERISLIRHGLPASEAKQIIADLALGQGATMKGLNLSQATVNKKAKQDAALTPAESERVLGVAKLVGQLEALVEDSGAAQGFDTAGFNTAAWMSRWLQEPLPALGGVRPIDLMDTMEGQALVSTVLAQMQSGAYA